MAWVITKLGTGEYWANKGGGFLYRHNYTEDINLSSDGMFDSRAGGMLAIDPLRFASVKEAQQAIIDYEAKPIADTIINNARRTDYTPPAIAIEARVKEMVKEAGK